MKASKLQQGACPSGHHSCAEAGVNKSSPDRVFSQEECIGTTSWTEKTQRLIREEGLYAKNRTVIGVNLFHNHTTAPVSFSPPGS